LNSTSTKTDKKRFKTLASLVCGMLRSKSSHLPHISKGLPQKIKAASRETAAKRFLENGHTTYKCHFLPFLTSFVRKILQKSFKKGQTLSISLVIDGSVMNSNHIALMVSMVIGKRAIPICWVVKKGKKGHFDSQMHLAVIEQTAAVFKHILAQLPPQLSKDSKITLLGDGEFDSVELQKLCRQELNWDYVFRTSSDCVLYENDDMFQPKTMHLDKNEVFCFIEGVDFSKARFKDVAFLYWHDAKKYKDPLFLVSNIDDPFKIMAAYQQRFAIETMFKDLKSRGFNLHKNRLTKIIAITNLIMIAALAFCILMKFGEQNIDNPLKEMIKRSDKNTYSIFSFAFHLLHYCLDNEEEFTFSSQMSMNDS
jgi:Transposase DDE domain